MLNKRIVLQISGSVNKARSSMVMQEGIKEETMGVSVVKNLDESSIASAMLSVLKSGSMVSCSAKFKAGDLYNYLGRVSAKGRRAAMKSMGETVPPHMLQTLRMCGWVAHKWPLADRNPDHSWNYYLRNSPGEPVKKRVVELPYFLAIESDWQTDAVYYECEGDKEKRIKVRVPLPLASRPSEVAVTV